MPNIDDFINIPLLVSAGLSFLVLIFLLIIKLRNTAKLSFIFFFAPAFTLVGSLYSYFKNEIFVYIAAVIIAVFLVLLYSMVKAVDNPKKREEKAAAKRAAELAAARDQNSISKEELAKIEAKHQRLLEVNKDLISKLSGFFSSDNSMENYLDYCNSLLTERVSADGCVILMVDDYDNTLAVKSFKGSFPPPYKLPDDLPHKPVRVETNLRFAQFPMQDNIFGEIFTSGEPAFIEDPVKDIRIFQNGPEDFLRCGTYIFVPVKQQEGVVGLVALSRQPDKSPFTKEDFDTAVILTDAISTTMKPLYSFLAYAEHTELNKDGSIATKYQKTLLPQKFPVIPGVQIGCFSNAVENVCGDYYDVIASRHDKVSFIMADVAGKGMNSLIVMIMIRAILRLAVNTNQSASTIMSWANRGICLEGSKIDHFASIALVNYNATTKEADVVTCGNNPVFHYVAAEKTLKQISTPSEPMGVTKDTVFTDIKVTMNSGDILVTCTDGVIETLNENGVQYSIENLKRAIIKSEAGSAKDISNKIKDDLKKYAGVTQQYDDQSVLVVKVQ